MKVKNIGKTRIRIYGRRIEVGEIAEIPDEHKKYLKGVPVEILSEGLSEVTEEKVSEEKSRKYKKKKESDG